MEVEFDALLGELRFNSRITEESSVVIMEFESNWLILQDAVPYPEYGPAPQFAHDAQPSPEYFPGAQFVHDVAPTTMPYCVTYPVPEYDPGPQFSHDGQPSPE